MPSTPPENIPEKEPVGPLVGAAIVVVLIMVGGIYFWSQRIDKLNDQNPIPTILGEISSTTLYQENL